VHYRPRREKGIESPVRAGGSEVDNERFRFSYGYGDSALDALHQRFINTIVCIIPEFVCSIGVQSSLSSIGGCKKYRFADCQQYIKSFRGRLTKNISLPF